MGENGSRLCESVGKIEKAAEEGRKRRGRIQLEPSRTRAFVLGLRSTPVIKSMFYSNDKADIIQADKAISSKDVPRNGASGFTWQEPRQKRGTLSYADRKST